MPDNLSGAGRSELKVLILKGEKSHSKCVSEPFLFLSERHLNPEVRLQPEKPPAMMAVVKSYPPMVRYSHPASVKHYPSVVKCARCGSVRFVAVKCLFCISVQDVYPDVVTCLLCSGAAFTLQQ